MRASPSHAAGRAGRGHRDRVPGGARRRGALGARQRLARHRRHCAQPRGSAEREARRATQALDRAARPSRSTSAPRSRTLSLSDRQACGIVRALLREPRVLILDEATSALDVATRDRLFAIVDRLSREGVGVIFITHRMDEIEEIGDRITVMRSGETVATLGRGEGRPARARAPDDRLGRARRAGRREAASAAARRGASVLQRRAVCSCGPTVARSTSRSAPASSIGVAGLEGHGQDEFLRGALGRERVAGEVVRHRDGGDVVDPLAAAGGAARHRLRAARAPRSTRCSRGCRSARTSRCRHSRRTPAAAGCARARHATRASHRTSTGSGSCSAIPDDAITTLSGGNQQKVVDRPLARRRSRGSCCSTTRPAASTSARSATSTGCSRSWRPGRSRVVMLSTEVDEHVELMDRVLVFREHELSARADARCS